MLQSRNRFEIQFFSYELVILRDRVISATVKQFSGNLDNPIVAGQHASNFFKYYFHGVRFMDEYRSNDKLQRRNHLFFLCYQFYWTIDKCNVGSWKQAIVSVVVANFENYALFHRPVDFHRFFHWVSCDVKLLHVVWLRKGWLPTKWLSNQFERVDSNARNPQSFARSNSVSLELFYGLSIKSWTKNRAIYVALFPAKN